MSEVAKMYENAGVKPYYDYTVLKEGYNGKITFTKRAVCGKAQLFKNKKLRIIQVLPFYPDFTAEKQLSLIKWLAKFNVRIEYTDAKYFIESHYHGYSVYTECFEQALAELINILWQDLTESERNEIKEILQ